MTTDSSGEPTRHPSPAPTLHAAQRSRPLGDMTVEPEPPEPDPLRMPEPVARRITNALKGLRR